MIRLTRILCALLLLSLFGPGLHGQVLTGTPPLGSFGGGPDIIDLANLNSHLIIPVVHRPGRGTDFTYDLSHDTSVWFISTSGGNKIWTPVLNWGWRGISEIASGYLSETTTGQTCPFLSKNPTGSVTVESNWVYHDPFGTPHPFERLR